MCRRRGLIRSHIKNKFITQEFFAEKIKEVLQHCNTIVPELTVTTTNEIIKKEMPRLFKLAIDKDRKISPKMINISGMVSKAFADHAPKMIEELFRQHMQNTTLNLYPKSCSSTAKNHLLIFNNNSPKCNRCRLCHFDNFLPKSTNCGKMGHKARDCRCKTVATSANAQLVVHCYECGERGHKSKKFLKRNNRQGGKATGRAYAMREVEQNLEPSVLTGTYLIVPFQVFCIWKAFGRNARDLGSFGEETDKTTDLHQHCPRNSLHWLETASQIQRDVVTTMIKTVSRDSKTASEHTTQPII
ncbi:retrovirus-related pol polyprotein from transposon TNT 1-94 [Tanacetum coccineum]